MLPETGTPPRRMSITLAARAGRLGGHLVLELTPDAGGDRSLHAVSRVYGPLLGSYYSIVVLEADPHVLRFRHLDADSLAAVPPRILRRPECASPYHYLRPGHLVLTGSGAEARAAWDCLLREVGLARGAMTFRRPR